MMRGGRWGTALKAERTARRDGYENNSSDREMDSKGERKVLKGQHDSTGFGILVLAVVSQGEGLVEVMQGFGGEG